MNRRSFIRSLSTYAATVALGIGIRLSAPKEKPAILPDGPWTFSCRSDVASRLCVGQVVAVGNIQNGFAVDVIRYRVVGIRGSHVDVVLA